MALPSAREADMGIETPLHRISPGFQVLASTGDWDEDRQISWDKAAPSLSDSLERKRWLRQT